MYNIILIVVVVRLVLNNPDPKKCAKADQAEDSVPSSNCTGPTPYRVLNSQIKNPAWLRALDIDIREYH